MKKGRSNQKKSTTLSKKKRYFKSIGWAFILGERKVTTFVGGRWLCACTCGKEEGGFLALKTKTHKKKNTISFIQTRRRHRGTKCFEDSDLLGTKLGEIGGLVRPTDMDRDNHKTSASPHNERVKLGSKGDSD